MVSISELQQQVQQQEAQLNAARAAAAAQEAEIEKRRQEVARNNQAQLRQQTGIEGTRQRQQKEEEAKRLRSAIGQIEEYKTQLSDYELQQLQPAKQNIQDYNNYIKQKAAYDRAIRLYKDGIPSFYIDDPLVKGYLREFEKYDKIQKTTQPQQYQSLPYTPAQFEENPVQKLPTFKKEPVKLNPFTTTFGFVKNLLNEPLPTTKTQYIPGLNLTFTKGQYNYGSISSQPEIQVTPGNLIDRPANANVFKLFDSPEQQKYRRYVRESSFKELAQQGDYPAVITKGAYVLGGLFVSKVSEPLRQSLGGKPSTPGQQRVVGEALGEAGLWLGFSPTFSTLTTTTQAEVETGVYEWVYDYTKQRWVIRNKLTGQVRETNISPNEFYGNVQEDLKTLNAIEQKVYLRKLKEKYFSQTTGGERSYQNMLKDLRSKGILKEQTSVGLPGQSQFVNVEGVGETGAGISTGNIFGINQFESVRSVGTGIQDIGKGDSRFKEIQIAFEGQKPKEKNLEALGALSLIGQISKTESLLGQKTITKTITAQKQKKISALGLLNLLRTSQGLKLKQPGKQTTKTRDRFGFPFSLGPGPKAKAAASLFEEDFKVFVRRKGKDILKGEFESLKKAEERLFGDLEGSLAASGFISKGKRKVRLKLPFGFRPSKVDPFRVVEKRNRRLNVPSEVKEIQLFRKRKS